MNTVKNVLWYIECSYGRSLKKDEIKALEKYQENYIKTYMCVKKAFLEIDPFNIAWVSWDEYHIEIKKTTIKLLETDFEDIEKTVNEVLDQYFQCYKEENKAHAKNLAKVIKKYKNLDIVDLYKGLCEEGD